MTTHVYRALAVEQARKNGHVGFSTHLDKNDMWKMVYEPGDNPADEFAKRYPDWCSHGEVSWVSGLSDDDDSPLRVGVLVFKVPFDKLPEFGNVAIDKVRSRVWISPHETDGSGFIAQPLNAERWSELAPKVGGQVATTQAASYPASNANTGDSASRAPAQPRERSAVGSPTKLVWEIADKMPTASRAEIIKACIEAGVNKSTAGTQYFHWNKARRGG